MKSRPEIHRYHEYRAFLRDWLAELKTSRRLSLRDLAKRSGVAASYLSMVLKGERSLSAEFLEKLKPHLGLTDREFAYLELLRMLSETDSADVRADVLRRIQRFRGYRDQNPREFEVYRYLSHWYYVVIREMAGLPGFRPDAKWIQERLSVKVPLLEIEKALEFLEGQGFIEKLKSGEVRLPQKYIECEDGVYRMALGQFHREMLDLAGKAIENTSREHRSIGGQTTAIPLSRFDEARRILDRALDEIAALSADGGGNDAVYHVALAAFPLASVGAPEQESDESAERAGGSLKRKKRSGKTRAGGRS